jgi:kumamolisin
MVWKFGCFLLALAVLASVLALDAQAESASTLHVRDVVRNGQAQPIGQLPLNSSMTLDVVLPLRDPAGLTAFLRELYDPENPSYRQFLTPAEFTARFGPTRQDYDATVSFLKKCGFTVVGGSRDGMDIQIEGPVSAVQAAFRLTMHTYQHPTENRTFYAPDREPATDLPFPLWHVSGLDNFSIPHPLLVSKTAYAIANGIDPDEVVSHATAGSGPSASFLGSDMRAAYYGGTALTGTGQNLGLLEYLGTDLTDLDTYFKNVGQTNNVPITLLSTDGTSTDCVYSALSGKCDDTEQTLDMTQAIGMAPGLSSLVVYVGSTDTAILSAMTTNTPLPTTIGCSWSWTPADPSTLEPYFQRMAAQGQSFFAASGDTYTWSASNDPWPADDDYVVSVGGTTLVTAGAAGPWKSEIAWGHSGGGVSPNGIAIPAWQQLPGVITRSNKGSTTYRNGPDVSANASISFYVCANQAKCTANNWGGTSFAAPMWAGYMALVNQQLADNGQPPIGFPNPTIYAQNVSGGSLSSAYAKDFHDISFGTSGSHNATTGFDLVTGWGSPNGTALINALAPPATSPTFALSASPGSVTVLQGTSGASTITTNALDGFDSAVTLAASGQPAGVTVSFSPAFIAAPGSGSSTMTLAVAPTTAPGNYIITISANGGGITQAFTLSLTVPAPVTSSFTISVSPASGSLQQGQSGVAVVTITVSDAFHSAIALSAKGLPSGVIGTFGPKSITSSGSSNFTLSASKTAPTGTYPITIAGVAGSTAYSTTLSLQVVQK